MTETTTELAAHELAAARLRQARHTHKPCAPIRELLAEHSPEAQMSFGYRVQHLLTQQAIQAGRRIVGAKIGLTSAAVQRQLGVDQPDSGVLFADMVREENTPIELCELLQPRIEAEVAFVLGADLAHADLDMRTVRDAVDFAVAALEIVDSRVANWDIALVDTIADNASSGLYVLGARPRSLSDVDLPAAHMTMTVSTAEGGDGEVVSTGTGAACLGNPLAALLWLARTARRFGTPLRAGDVVLSGALGPMVTVEAGAGYEATIEGLGTVRASFGARR
jgi:2-keto-4-pentenoate hydratase